ncbi:TetR/AcrR family transcriptional regulator [Anaerocolumna xylanovorans]|uniref:Transcriptional regulator, TetR family n=1 Tax=Anaerocolumna xylanovorans DSM 12503 TaxID=1121345 RepID=A0A1M7XWD5_9FIRM|nr:TetR/AcrR family transcriptional regulator [Anaerocolumna xylanovorans]SHO43071.1 transcriptional regulator, TetR family [Anaerocolumna xylanovorans DSM 12503]
MREVKPVEVRKQEILHAAIKVFKEKGYDKTSISDIATSLKISQGLCYRYFKSKEEIFESAVDVYAGYIADKMIEVLCNPKMNLLEKIIYIPNFSDIEKENKEYYDIFHGQGADSFHDRLSLNICKKVCPHVQRLLTEECEKGQLRLKDPKTAASFMVFGQLGILIDKEIEGEKKNIKIMEFIKSVLEEITL